MTNDVNDIKRFLQNNLETYLDQLQQMVAINSFTTNRDGVNKLGEFTANLFSTLGFTSEFVQAADSKYGKHLFLKRTNMDGTDIENGPTLAMISHLDTVFSPDEEKQNNFHWWVDGDRIYGPGTVDIKGGTVMIYMVLDVIRTFDPQLFDNTNWVICLDACEEALTLDFSEQCLRRFPANTIACLVFEGGSIENDALTLVTSRKGRATFNVRVTGRSAHAGNAHQYGANAIVQMAHTIQKITALTNYSKDLTFNVGTVIGGSVVNRVPHTAEADIEMRTFSPDVFADAVVSMLSLDGTSDVSSTDGFPCTVSVELLDQMAPWPLNENTLKLYDIWELAGKLLGLQIMQEARGGLSDGNPLSDHFPTIDGLGPVGSNAHCSEQSDDGSKEQEYVLRSSFVPKALLNTLSILKLVSDHLPN